MYRSGCVLPSRRTRGIIPLSGHMTQALSGSELHQSVRTTRAEARGAFKGAKTTSTARRAFTGLLCTRCNIYNTQLKPNHTRVARRARARMHACASHNGSYPNTKERYLRYTYAPRILYLCLVALWSPPSATES